MHVNQVRLLNDAVLVRPIKTGCSLSPGGDILIPPTAHQKPHEGTVLAVGNGMRSKKTGERTPLPLAPGEYVTWERFSEDHAVRLNVEGEGECFILPSSQILAALSNS